MHALPQSSVNVVTQFHVSSMLTNADRRTRGVHGVQKHSSLDELTFNRDFDISHSTGAHGAQLESWKFHPSYSGFAASKLTRTRALVYRTPSLTVDLRSSPCCESQTAEACVHADAGDNDG